MCLLVDARGQPQVPFLSLSTVFIYLLIYLETGLLNESGTQRLVNLLPVRLCPHHQAATAKDTDAYHHAWLCMHIGDMNSCPHACMAGTSLTEP